MGLGNRWARQIKRCVGVARFSILVNRLSVCFLFCFILFFLYFLFFFVCFIYFFKEIWVFMGYPLSTSLFVLAMESFY